MIRVCALYALSGFVSLGYQVAWLRIGVDRFGSTDLTFVLVLCSFIAGVGAGALASRPLDAWLAARSGLRRPLVRYGMIELAVSATALPTLLALPPALFGSFPYVLEGALYEPTAAYQIGRAGWAVLCVFVPCFLMGVTFPLLCEAFGDHPRFPSLLYACNTFGACCGVLACEFLLIPRLGHDRMFAALVAANAALGGYFALAGGRIGTAPPRPAAAPADADLQPARRASPDVLLACAVLSGLLAGSLEADLFKRLSFLGIRTSTAISFVSFWAVLAIFAGSALVRALPRLRLVHIQLAYAAALALHLATAGRLIALHGSVFTWLAPTGTQDAALPTRIFFPAGLAPLWVFVGLALFPSFLLVSLLLPWACNHLQGARRHLGTAYGANTIAFCAGTIAFTWLAPRVSIFYSLGLQSAVLAIGVAFLALLGERGRLAAWKPLLAGAALLAACVLTPAGFDRSAMIPDTPPTRAAIRAVRSDSAHTTFVVEDAEGDMLYFDNVSLSNASPRQQTYMGLMAHFPLLAHPDPRDVLLICYGVGNTAGAIATHDSVQAIDVVEISRNVILTAPEFAETNQGVHDDPRVRFIHDDGRSFLAQSDRSWDLITSEPPPPLHTGVYRLYSREYYRDVLGHLDERGLMSQWVPVAQLPDEAVALVIRTFLDVFPHALLFTGMREELILVGSRHPIDLATLERRFGASPRVAAHLAQLGVPDATGLLARLVQGDASLRRRYGPAPGARVVTDRHNELAHLFLDPSRPGAVPFDPQGVIAEWADAGLAGEAALRGIVTHLGRLQHHARGFPVSSLVALREEGGGGATLVGVDWEAVARLEDRSDAHLAQGRLREARDALREALTLALEQPKLLERIAALELALGAPEAAIAALERFTALEPDDARALHQLAGLLESRGAWARAADAYRRALARDASLPTASLRLAWLLATSEEARVRDGDEALAWAERGGALHGADEPEALAARAAAQAERGDYRAAVRLQAQAYRVAPGHLREDYRRGLEVYREARPYRAGVDGPRAYPWRHPPASGAAAARTARPAS